MPVGIYPPILVSAQPAFVPSEYELTGYPINFTLQNVTSLSNIGHIQIRLVDQQSNLSIVNTSLFPDGIIYKAKSEIKTKEDSSGYYVTIDTGNLKQSWTIGRCYKVQLRFGSTEKFTSVESFAEWKQKQVENSTFSEWSTVMVIKAINKPTVEILNTGELKDDTLTKTNMENSQMPVFRGVYKTDDTSKEQLDKYQFVLYSYDGSDAEILESSKWIQATFTGEYRHTFKTFLIDGETYCVHFNIITVNGYQTSVEYTFQVSITSLDPIEGVTMKVIGGEDLFCRENGCLKVALKTAEEESLTGCYVLTRTSELSNYGVYEDLKYFNFYEETFDNEILFTDYTIESGIRYKYGFQYQNSKGLRSAVLQDETPQSVDFEFSYLYRDGVQLRVSLNQKISSFKHSVLATKQDTLGDIYPHLVKNGYANYAEFTMTGTISLQMDEDQTFFTQNDKGLYYNGELIIPADKFTVDTRTRNETKQEKMIVDSSITADNVFIERKFREKVEEFLNDFSCKLYKSPTEGNIVIGLMNVSMTPNATLGRMIFDFSATAYEVADATLNSLNETGIIEIGEYSEDKNTLYVTSFGQVSEIYDGNPADKDVMAIIKKQEEKSVGEGKYWLELIQLNSLWVERYPEKDLSGKIFELESQGKLEEKAFYERLKAAMEQASPTDSIKLRINGKEILIAAGRRYELKEPVTKLEVVSVPYPIIINYVAQMQRVLNVNAKEVTSIDVSRVWGQISGVFTDNPNILTQYNYNYKYSLTSRIYNYEYSKDDDKPVYIIADDTTYGLYKTRNLYEIIQEETRRLVADIYGIEDGFYLDEDGNWTNGTYYYKFSDIISFTIEADPYSKLKIGKSEVEAVDLRLGPTGRYTVSPMESLVKYIELPEPQFAIVDFKCLTTQTKMG